MTRYQTFTALCFLLTLAPPAMAQQQNPDRGGYFFSREDEKKENQTVIDQYSKKYRPDIEEQTALPSLLPKGAAALQLVRPRESLDGDFILRIASPFPVTGCVVMEPPAVQIEENPPVLSLTVTEGGAYADHSKRNPQYECSTGLNLSYADVLLNRDDLIDDGINRIMIQGKGTAAKTLDVDINEHRVILRNPGAELVHWFYPDNTVTLYVPALKGAQDVKEEIRKLGISKGLVPLDSVIKNFAPRRDFGSTHVYFVDPAGLLSREIKVAGGPVLAGKAQSYEIFHGPQGEYKRPKDVQVYARLPGEND